MPWHPARNLRLREAWRPDHATISPLSPILPQGVGAIVCPRGDDWGGVHPLRARILPGP
jgi:hypothetical protein